MTDRHDAHEAAHHHDDGGDAALAELLDLDGEMLRQHWTSVLTWVRAAATVTGRGRILDLGAGTGTGTIGLAQHFAESDIYAVDASEPMLERIRAKALALGLTDRIHTVQANLDDVWPAVDPVDVVWASMSLHHLADPDRVLGDVFTTTRPGGLVAVVEFSEHLRFLPPDIGLGRPGLEERCLDGLKQEHADSLPNLGSDWSPRLEAAGFGVLSERAFAIELDPPHSPATARYARAWLRRLMSGLADRLSHDDLDVLATLVDGDGPQSLSERDDLQVRGSRTVTLARRP
ncbi:MAG: class I SAM-dependent methyltransferase [Nocardioidaceae bacterium]